MSEVATQGEGDRSARADELRAETRAESPSRRRVWPWIVLVVVAGGAFLVWQRMRATPDSQGAKNVAPAARAVPVVVAKARTGDLPIYIDGLGTVNAFNTVTVRTRVDGELVKVAFTEGQTVKAGDALAEIDPRPFQVQLEQAEGQLARDQALLKNANLDLNRYQEAREAVPRQQIDTAAANVAQFEAATKVDQSQVDNAKLQLTYSRIISPLDGVIGLRFVDQGNTVHASDASGLAVITQLEPIAVQFSIPQDQLPDVMQAMRGGELSAIAFDRDFKRELAHGRLQAVDNQINASTGTVKLKAVFDNKERTLFPNQFVNVRLLVDTKKGSVLVPIAAVQRSPKSTFVYVVKSDETVEVRPVTVGPSERDTISITQGVKDGETVVTDGVDKLQSGSKVAARDEAGAAEDAKKDPRRPDAKRDASPDAGPAKPGTSGSSKTPSDASESPSGASDNPSGASDKPGGSSKKPGDAKDTHGNASDKRGGAR
jgi:multidrug efflux system membrane fusion protein